MRNLASIDDHPTYFGLSRGAKQHQQGQQNSSEKNDGGDNETWVWYGLVPIINIFWDNHHPDLMVHHPFPPIKKHPFWRHPNESGKKATTDQKPPSPSCVGGDGELRSPLIF